MSQKEFEAFIDEIIDHLEIIDEEVKKKTSNKSAWPKTDKTWLKETITFHSKAIGDVVDKLKDKLDEYDFGDDD